MTTTTTTRWLTAQQQHAWRAYLVATTLLTERLDRDLREQHDLSLPEYEILVRLSEAPGRQLRMAMLAQPGYSHRRTDGTGRPRPARLLPVGPPGRPGRDDADRTRHAGEGGAHPR